MQSCTGEEYGVKVTLEGDRTTSIEGAEVTPFCKLFHIRATVTGKARLPTVDDSTKTATRNAILTEDNVQ